MAHLLDSTENAVVQLPTEESDAGNQGPSAQVTSNGISDGFRTRFPRLFAFFNYLFQHVLHNTNRVSRAERDVHQIRNLALRTENNINELRRRVESLVEYVETAYHFPLQETQF